MKIVRRSEKASEIENSSVRCTAAVARVNLARPTHTPKGGYLLVKHAFERRAWCNLQVSRGIVIFAFISCSFSDSVG